ncbi:hypothetical protein ACFPM0_31965 [Pseudonocardia sulfidoxydans]
MQGAALATSYLLAPRHHERGHADDDVSLTAACAAAPGTDRGH